MRQMVSLLDTLRSELVKIDEPGQPEPSLLFSKPLAAETKPTKKPRQRAGSTIAGQHQTLTLIFDSEEETQSPVKPTDTKLQIIMKDESPFAPKKKSFLKAQHKRTESLQELRKKHRKSQSVGYRKSDFLNVPEPKPEPKQELPKNTWAPPVNPRTLKRRK